jgi:hypothetical protein
MKFDRIYPLKLGQRQRADGRIAWRGYGRTDGQTEEVVSIEEGLSSITVQQYATVYSLLYFCKLLYIFRVVTPPIIRSIHNCNYIIWHWSNFEKYSVWSQLKMRGMDPSLLTSAIVVELELVPPTPSSTEVKSYTFTPSLYRRDLLQSEHITSEKMYV